MKRKRPQIHVLFAFLLLPIALYGQAAGDQEQLKYQRALQEIDGVIVDTAKLDESLAVVSIKSKAASLIWRYDRNRAQTLFLDLWKFIDLQSSDSFDQDEARTVLLKNLYPINSGLAGRLLKELSARQKEESTLRAQATGNDPGLRRLANLSSGLMDRDPAIAARLLEQSLSMAVTPTALSVLSRLRDENPELANYVVSQTLEHLKSRPTIVALTGLHLLTGYIFPSEPYLAESPEGGSRDERLRFQYFSIAYDVLKLSLQETDSLLTKEKRYTEKDLRFRAIYQGQVALVLAALAPRYGPQFVQELNVLARRLSGSTPANITEISSFIVARLKGEEASSDNPEIAIAVAIANGDFDVARRYIEKIEDKDKRNVYSQLLAKAEFKALVAEANLSEALSVARRIENVNLRVLLYLQLAKAAYRKDDVTFSRLILNEARSVLASPEKDGLRARLLLALATEMSGISESDAIDILHNAVIMINSLPKSSSPADSSDQSPSEQALSLMNDPRSFMDSSELQRAFSSVARVDFDGTLVAAARINPASVQLIAKLATVETALARGAKKPRLRPEKKGSPNGQPKHAF